MSSSSKKASENDYPRPQLTPSIRGLSRARLLTLLTMLLLLLLQTSWSHFFFVLSLLPRSLQFQIRSKKRFVATSIIDPFDRACSRRLRQWEKFQCRVFLQSDPPLEMDDDRYKHFTWSMTLNRPQKQSSLYFSFFLHLSFFLRFFVSFLSLSLSLKLDLSLSL